MTKKHFRIGEGIISSNISCFLGIINFILVLCFQYPDSLDIFSLNSVFNTDSFQQFLKYSLYCSLCFSLCVFCIGKKRKLSATGALFTIAAFAFGGYTSPSESTSTTLLFDLNWLVYTFIGSAVLFVFLEKIIPQYKTQNILRPEWLLDFFYFVINHFLITAILLMGNYFFTSVFNLAANSYLQSGLQSLPTAIQFIIILLIADFILYWSHRMFHESPYLWRFHAVHHSTEHMDWMTGSRNHIIQTIVDRGLTMLPLYLLGFNKQALDIYIAFAAFHAVYVHANINLPLGPFKYLIATPQYHHWHHSSQAPAIDTNYAVHMPLYDMIFKTYHMPINQWPAHYGTTKRLPRTFFGQLSHPFSRN